MSFVNIICPVPQMELITLRAWPGYRLSMAMKTMLWKTPSAGKAMSTISGIVFLTSGRKIRSTAFPM